MLFRPPTGLRGLGVPPLGDELSAISVSAPGSKETRRSPPVDDQCPQPSSQTSQTILRRISADPCALASGSAACRVPLTCRSCVRARHLLALPTSGECGRGPLLSQCRPMSAKLGQTWLSLAGSCPSLARNWPISRKHRQQVWPDHGEPLLRFDRTRPILVEIGPISAEFVRTRARDLWPSSGQTRPGLDLDESRCYRRRLS